MHFTELITFLANVILVVFLEEALTHSLTTERDSLHLSTQSELRKSTYLHSNKNTFEISIPETSTRNHEPSSVTEISTQEISALSSHENEIIFTQEDSSLNSRKSDITFTSHTTRRPKPSYLSTHSVYKTDTSSNPDKPIERSSLKTTRRHEHSSAQPTSKALTSSMPDIISSKKPDGEAKLMDNMAFNIIMVSTVVVLLMISLCLCAIKFRNRSHHISHCRRDTLSQQSLIIDNVFVASDEPPPYISIVIDRKIKPINQSKNTISPPSYVEVLQTSSEKTPIPEIHSHM